MNDKERVNTLEKLGLKKLKISEILKMPLNVVKAHSEIQDEIDPNKFPRFCSECKKGMWEGYCIEGGQEYYCSDSCLEKHMTQEEFADLYDDGDGDSYWTEWTEEDIEEEE